MARTSTWGGKTLHLLDAVNSCLVYFMRADALDSESSSGRQLYEYLWSITPDGADPVPQPFTIIENIVSVPLGNPVAGEAVYAAACRRCHGEAHTGRGSIITPTPFVLPESTSEYDATFPGIPPGLLVIEKVRHGGFFGLGGVMAPYSLEAMSDEQLGDLLAFLGLPAGAP